MDGFNGICREEDVANILMRVLPLNGVGGERRLARPAQRAVFRLPGRIRDDLPPATGAMTVLALAIFPFIVRPVAEQVLELRLSGRDLEIFEDQVSAFVQRGFSK